jgi:hypothetical protein
MINFLKCSVEIHKPLRRIDWTTISENYNGMKK